MEELRSPALCSRNGKLTAWCALIHCPGSCRILKPRDGYPDCWEPLCAQLIPYKVHGRSDYPTLYVGESRLGLEEVSYANFDKDSAMRFCRTEISDEMIREVVDPLWAPDRDGCSVKCGESRASEVGVVVQ